MADRYAPHIKWISIGIIVLSLLVIARTLPLAHSAQAIESWINSLGMWGPVVYALVYILAVVLFLPGSILTLAAGAFFGLWVGTVTASLASTTGAALAFLMARYLARERVAAMARRNRKFEAIDKAIGEGGWKIVALLRLSPAVPFNLQNYLYGLTPIRFWPYLLASWLAMLPGTVLYVYIGHVAGTAVAGERQRSPFEWVMLVVGLLATLAVTTYVTYLARKKLKEQTSIQDTPNEGSPQQDAMIESPPRRRQASKVWVALATAMLAILLGVAAGYTLLNPQIAREWAERLLGPG